jgi:hypothetical protein
MPPKLVIRSVAIPGTKVWIASITRFVDDYKMRYGEDPSSSYSRICSTKEKAVKWIITNVLDDYKDHAQYKDDYVDNVIIDKLESLEAFIEGNWQGEYVTRPITWDITEDTIQ